MGMRAVIGVVGCVAIGATASGTSTAAGATPGHVKIISMGLPKTGTTATASALELAGLQVSHNNGDTLARGCDVIINTWEDKYDRLHETHSRARWIVTLSADVDAWAQSVSMHWGRKFNESRLLEKTPARFILQNVWLRQGAREQENQIRNAGPAVAGRHDLRRLLPDVKGGVRDLLPGIVCVFAAKHGQVCPR